MIGFGEIGNEFLDENCDSYYEIYACSDLYVKRIVPHEEIVEMAKDLARNHTWRLNNFIMRYPLSKEEALEMKEILSKYETKYKKMIDYYYLGDKNAFR